MRVVIADDSLLLREGLARIVAAEDITVVGSAADADEARVMVTETAPDLLVLDVRMPPSYTTEGLDLAAELRSAPDPIPILLLSQQVHVGGALGLFDRDAAGLGYLLKDRVLDVDDFVLALRQVAAGGSVIDPLVVRALVSRHDPGLFLDQLSPRELEVLELMARGLSNAAIARAMVVSPRTVETHVNNVFLKLRIPATEDDNRRVRAVVTYLAPSPQAEHP